MAKFVKVPRTNCGIDLDRISGFDLEQVLYYKIVEGDTVTPGLIEALYNRNQLENIPVKMILHFKNGETVEIWDFEKCTLDEWFYPALGELGKGIVDKPISIPQCEDFTHNSGVYFIQSEITKRIKIGHSKNIKKRIKSIESSEPLRLLHVIPNGTTDTETALHKKFSHLRVMGREWFEGTQELAHYIHSLRSK